MNRGSRMIFRLYTELNALCVVYYFHLYVNVRYIGIYNGSSAISTVFKGCNAHTHYHRL